MSFLAFVKLARPYSNEALDAKPDLLFFPFSLSYIRSSYLCPHTRSKGHIVHNQVSELGAGVRGSRASSAVELMGRKRLGGHK